MEEEAEKNPPKKKNYGTSKPYNTASMTEY